MYESVKMNGNFGRSTYSSGSATPFNSPQNPPMGNGFIFDNPGGPPGRHCFGSRRMGPCGGRPFHTGRGGSYGRHRNQQSTPVQPPPQMAPTYQPQSPSKGCYTQRTPNTTYQTNPQGFINGIKKIVNNFINPQLNCDFYSDHHRFYNPKYRNNYMVDRQMNPIGLNLNAGSVGVQTVFLNLGDMNPNVAHSYHHEKPAPHAQFKATAPPSQPTPSAATFEFTIFTSDDFPALPEVKKQEVIANVPPPPPVTKVANKLPRRRRKCREPKPSLAKESATTPASEYTCEDFIVLSKPKININNSSKSGPSSATCQKSTSSFPWRCSPRARQISECSDDSFVICFSEEAPEGVLEVTRDSEESDLDTTSSESSSEDDDVDETDHQLKVPDVEQLDSGFDEKKDKKVRFNLKPKVHMMYKWDYAYRAARKGDWEKYARDRDRFQKRIERVANILNTVLDTQHREKIYTTRFCDSALENDAKTAKTVNSATKQNDEITNINV